MDYLLTLLVFVSNVDWGDHGTAKTFSDIIASDLHVLT